MRMQWVAGLLCVGLWVSSAAQDGIRADRPGSELVLTLEPGAGNPRNSEGGLVQLKDSRILFAYSHFTGGADDDAAAHIAGRFSGGIAAALAARANGRIRELDIDLIQQARLEQGAILQAGETGHERSPAPKEDA